MEDELRKKKSKDQNFTETKKIQKSEKRNAQIQVETREIERKEERSERRERERMT